MTPKRATRDWVDAASKREDGCRVGYYDGYDSCSGDIELAHTVGRKYDGPQPFYIPEPPFEDRKKTDLWVDPNAVVPLCKKHHGAYDGRRLDLLPYLTLEEQGFAASKLGLVRALRRVSPTPHEGEATAAHRADRIALNEYGQREAIE